MYTSKLHSLTDEQRLSTAILEASVDGHIGQNMQSISDEKNSSKSA
jgi:hypothetical protein